MSQQGEEAASEGSGSGEAKQKQQAHFVFIPLMAQGHVIPSLDTAFLLATHGAVCSMVATQSTAAVHRAVRAGGPSAGVPAGVRGGRGRQPGQHPAGAAGGLLPGGGAAGGAHPGVLAQAGAARDLHRLRLLPPGFFPMCAFCALCEHNVNKFNCLQDSSEEGDDMVAVPFLDKTLELRREEAPCFLRHPAMGTLGEDIDRALAQGAGLILNTFMELEPDHVRGLASAWGKRVWTVGPVSLHHPLATTTTTCRGDAASMDCLQWLDGKEPGSVVYVSFGTLAHKTDPDTLLELALGLEASGHPFVWVLGKADQPFADSSQPLRDLEARVGGAGAGRIVRGWVPQLLVLSHAAVGCFLTHCGWNSVMETIVAAKPVVTWPCLIHTDHFVNEKLAVDVLGIGLSVRPKDPHMPVRREAIQAALTAVLRGGEQGQEMRTRVRALSLKAKAAMQPGGSSHANLSDLVHRFTI